MIARVALAAAAVGLGFACGAATKPRPRPASLPPAGSDQDDGTGVLARWSMSAPLPTDTDLLGGPRDTDDTDDTDDDDTDNTDGAPGDTGDTRYGGSRYAGYRYTLIVRSGPTRTPKPYADYVVRPHAQPGAVEGTVRWPDAPATADVLTVSGETAPGCPPAIANDTLTLGPDHSVANAVVFLEDIREGHSLEPIGGVLERRECALRPHVVLIAPIGAPLRFTNADPAAARYTATRHTATDDRARAPAFELDTRGHGDAVRAAPDEPGFYAIEPAAAGDPASAWVVVARNPYYALTDHAGRFRFDGVPPGTYTVRVWHAPVRGVTANTAAVTATRRVRVTARKTSSVSVSLPSGR